MCVLWLLAKLQWQLSLCAGLGREWTFMCVPMAARQIVMFKLFCSLSLVLAEAGSIVPLLRFLFFVFGTKQDWMLLALQGCLPSFDLCFCN
jgi:hypothetical protein